MDKTAIEIGESEEGLYNFDLPWSGPFPYGFNLSHVHRKYSWRQYKSEVFHSFSMKSTLCWVQEETILLEPLEYLSDMFNMLFQVLGVDEDVVKVDDHEHVKEVREDVIHEVLEGGGGICEPKGHHTPLK